MKTQQGLVILIFDLKIMKVTRLQVYCCTKESMMRAGREDVYKIIKKGFRLISSTYIR